MKQDHRQVPDWLVERLALGELDPEMAADVRRRLIAEGRSPDELIAAMNASNRDILAALPPAAAAATIRQRAAAVATQPRARKWAFIWGGPLALAGGVALMVLLVRPQTPTPVGEKPEVIIDKGGPPSLAPRLHVYRRGPSGAERLTDGARVSGGDVVQLTYGCRRGGYGVVLSIDGARNATLHWPHKGDGGAAALQAAGEVRLPTAYELDDAPGFERFFLVRAEGPFSVSVVLDAARALAAQPAARQQPLPLPAGFEQTSLTLDKANTGKRELP